MVDTQTLKVGDLVRVVSTEIKDREWPGSDYRPDPSLIGKEGKVTRVENRIRLDGTSFPVVEVTWDKKIGGWYNNTFELHSLELVPAAPPPTLTDTTTSAIKLNIPKASVSRAMMRKAKRVNQITKAQVILTDRALHLPKTVDLIVLPEDKFQIISNGVKLEMNLIQKIKGYLDPMAKLRVRTPGLNVTLEQYVTAAKLLSTRSYQNALSDWEGSMSSVQNNLDYYTNAVKSYEQRAKDLRAEWKNFEQMMAVCEKAGITVLPQLKQRVEGASADAKANHTTAKDYARRVRNYAQKKNDLLKTKPVLAADEKQYATGYTLLDAMVKSGEIEKVTVTSHGLDLVFAPMILDVDPAQRCECEDRCTSMTSAKHHNKYYLGRIRAKLHAPGTCGQYTEDCRMISFTSLSYDGGLVPHPHVNSQSCTGVCMSAYYHHFQKAFASGDLGTVAALTKKFLESYNQHSPLRYLDEIGYAVIEKDGAFQQPSGVIDGSL